MEQGTQSLLGVVERNHGRPARIFDYTKKVRWGCCFEWRGFFIHKTLGGEMMRTRYGSLVSLFAVVAFLFLSGCGGGPGTSGALKPVAPRPQIASGCEVGNRIAAPCKYDRQVTVGPSTADRRLRVRLGTEVTFSPGKATSGTYYTKARNVFFYEFNGTVLVLPYPKGKLIIEHRNGAWVRIQ